MNIQRSSLIPSLNELSAELLSYGKFDQPASKDDDDPPTTVALPKKKKFPEHLKAFLQFIPGNDCCPDCEVRCGDVDIPQEFKNGLPSRSACVPLWANVECGSLICEECAGSHIRMNRKTSSIMSMDDSTWSLPQILSVLEGGNKNFLDALNRLDREKDSLQKSRSKVGFGTRNLTAEKAESCHPFEHRYKYNYKIESYKDLLATRVAHACKENGGAAFTQEENSKIIPEEEVNNGTSLAAYLVNRSKSGRLKGDKAASILLKENYPDHSRPRQASPSKDRNIMKSTKPSSNAKPQTAELTHSRGEEKAVSVFFERIFEDEAKKAHQECNQTVSSTRCWADSELRRTKFGEGRHRSLLQEQKGHSQTRGKRHSTQVVQNSQGLSYSTRVLEENKQRCVSSKRHVSVLAEVEESSKKNHPLQEQHNNHPQRRKSKTNSLDVKWDGKGRYYSTHVVEDKKQLRVSSKSSKRDLTGWCYQNSSGESRSFRQSSRRVSIDSMINPILMTEKCHVLSLNARSAAA